MGVELKKIDRKVKELRLIKKLRNNVSRYGSLPVHLSGLREAKNIYIYIFTCEQNIIFQTDELSGLPDVQKTSEGW